MQEVITVFRGIKSDFIKAMIYSRDLEAFEALGFVKSGDLLPDELPIEIVVAQSEPEPEPEPEPVKVEIVTKGKGKQKEAE